MLGDTFESELMLSCSYTDNEIRGQSASQAEAVVFSCPANINDFTVLPQHFHILAACQDYNIYVLDTVTGKILHTLEGYGDNVLCVAGSATATLIAAGGYEKSIRLWTLRDRRFVLEDTILRGHRDWVSALRFSATDEQLLFSCSHDCTARMWNAHSKVCLRTFATHREPVFGLELPCTGQTETLVTYGQDGAIMFWQAVTGREVAAIEAHVGGVTSVVFSRDAQLFVSGGNDSVARVWRTSDFSCLLVLVVSWRVSGVSFTFNTDHVALCFLDSAPAIYSLASLTQVEVLGRLHAQHVRRIATARLLTPRHLVQTGLVL
jgi:WD40 repeat protein